MLSIVPKRVEARDHGVRFRPPEPAARVGLDRLDEVGGAAIVQEEDPLAEPPEGRRSELISFIVRLLVEPGISHHRRCHTTVPSVSGQLF